VQWPRTQAIQGASTRWSHFPRVPKLPAPFIVGGAVCPIHTVYFPLTFADSPIRYKPRVAIIIPFPLLIFQ
jgi:hypothetical protein